MRKSTKSTSVQRFYCNVFGHRYEVSKKVTSYVKEYQCQCCKKELTTNSNGHLTELTPTFKEINSILSRIHEARTVRLKQKTISSSIYS
ncbi:MAG: hypothetical protein HKN00_01945 [Flavobacteriaceae bacterium]|nr:hypothetical protein [Bacteroidia bacterium]MBT8287727.1 hypothetical protein [Bacteroidia bacterium]NNF73916.1 hypothetical protein [Flavobacteriaceae bacterium]NNK71858.1 hypothetical protein [Flavobacteriaceae bacterium]